MRLRVFALLSMLSIIAANGASGQLCAGTAPFSGGPVRLAVISQFDDNSSMLAGGLALGATNGVFGGLYAGRTSIEDIEESGTNYGGHIGFATPVDKAKKVELCPTVTMDRLTGSFDTGFGVIDVSGTRVGLGIGFGASTSTSPSPTFDFVPFASFAFNHATTNSTFAGATEKITDDFSILTVGGGFVLNRIVTFQPNVAIPFGTDSGDPIYGITVAINIGKKK